jgi:3-phosphoshikimate 1-carboxyvinyltransferase
MAAARPEHRRPIRVRGDVSSQFLTALLLALPLVTAQGPVTIEVDGELISKPYIDITLRLLARFGIAVEREGWQRFVLPQGSAYRTPGRIHVEGDASSASYFIALGAIAGTDQPVRIEGVGLDSIQGDIRFVEAAQAMGAQVTGGPGWLEVQRGAWPLKAMTLDCNHIPDAAMTLAVMALYADGPTRCATSPAGASRKPTASPPWPPSCASWAPPSRGPRLHRSPAPGRPWQAASIHTYDDHRMAMCLSLAAFNPLVAAGVPVRILDPKCVGKTFPDYFETLFEVVTPPPTRCRC